MGDVAARIGELVRKCDRCGACLAVCPLYAQNGREIASPRGKIAVVRGLMDDGLAAVPALAETFRFCLLCRACTGSCPNKIPVAEIMIEARRYAAGQWGHPARHRVIAALLGNDVLLGLMAGVLRWTRNAKPPAGGPSASGAPASRGQIAYFQGCAMRLFFPAASRATVQLLKRTGGVVVPPGVCCGSPHLAYGMVDQALALARKNIERFAGADLVVTDCASCGSSLKEYGSRLAGDPRWADRALAFGRKVTGLSEYLFRAGYRPRGGLAAKVTYHDPCHLARGQGIRNEPRDLLRLAGDYVELPSAGRCCGGAGAFHLDYPAAAGGVLRDKTADITRTGAAMVVTECPACLMQLGRGRRREHGEFEVRHISQVL